MLFYLLISGTIIAPPPHTANSINLLGDVSHLSLAQLEDWGIGLAVGIMWEEALHSALMPVTPQASMGSLAEGALPHLNFTKLRKHKSTTLLLNFYFK